MQGVQNRSGLVVLIFLLFGCTRSYCPEEHSILSDAIIKTVSCNQNRSLIFISDLGEIDTMRVVSVEHEKVPYTGSGRDKRCPTVKGTYERYVIGFNGTSGNAKSRVTQIGVRSRSSEMVFYVDGVNYCELVQPSTTNFRCKSYIYPSANFTTNMNFGDTLAM